MNSRAAPRTFRRTADRTEGLTPVLVTADDFYASLAAVRALRAAGYAPWVAASEPGVYAARSRAAAGTVEGPDSGRDREGFVRALAAAAGRLGVAAVLPGTESHLLTLAGRESDFAPAAFGVPPREAVERATDKELLPELARKAGLGTPPTVEVSAGERRALAAFGFPAVVKPRRSRLRDPDGTFSGSPRPVASAREAEEALQNLPGGRGLLQPYVPGTLTSVSGVAWRGELVCAMRQVSHRIWPVPAGVSSYAETFPQDPALERGVGRLLKEAGWSGVFQTQFIRDKAGDHHLIDFNPRIYGSLALAVFAGLNLPGIWADLLLGRKPSVGGYRVGARFRHEEKDVLALARMLKNGETLGALRGLAPRRDTTHAIFSSRDPGPLLVSAGKLARRVIR